MPNTRSCWPVRLACFSLIALASIIVLAGCRAKSVESLAVQPLDDLTGTRSRAWQAAAFCEAVKATLPGKASCAGSAASRTATHQAGGWIGNDGYHLHVYAGNDRIREWTLPASTPLEDAADALAQQLNLPHQAMPEARKAALRPFGEALAGAPNANEKLAEAVQRDPSFGSAYLALADRGAPPRPLLDQATSGKAEPHAIADLKIRTAEAEGNLSLRIEGLRDLTRLEPQNAALHAVLGGLLSRLHRPADAIAPLKQAIAADPDNPNYRNALAYAYSYANRHKEAQQAAEEYRRIAPDDPNALDTAGEVAFRAGRFADSATLYEQAFRANPEFQQGFPLWRAALAKLAAGDRIQARTWRDEFFRTPAGAAARAIGQGLWLALEGDHAAANQAWRASGSPDALLYAAAAALAQGDRAQAQKLIASLPPSNAGAALVRFVAQDPAPPAVWKARVEKSVRGPESAMVLALALTLNGHWQDAAQAWNTALEAPSAAPGLPEALAAWTSAKAGNKNANFRLVHSATAPGPLDPFYVLLAPDLFAKP